ncbi:AMP-binding protein, partial [Pseudomonadales bacterium]|nr:AMP-binding protein [Pseudomonadales bacterium]
GIPDERYGEIVCAWVQLKQNATLNEESVKSFCRDQITHFKVPSLVRFVDEFPMTVTGKIQKFKMRETMIEQLVHV